MAVYTGEICNFHHRNIVVENKICNSVATVQKLYLGLGLMVITKELFQVGVRFGMEVDHKYTCTLRMKYCL
jgi:hypothetical protein